MMQNILLFILVPGGKEINLSTENVLILSVSKVDVLLDHL